MDSFYYGYFPPPGILLILAVLWIALAIGNGYIAQALGKHVVVWVVLSLIPLVNYFFYIYIAYAIVLGILHRLNDLHKRLGAVDT